ncbi:uncharacterized protein LOC132952059 [Metopolophium dirhodum]|uniref:uncharacterized protein LOC132952059 n=1 Tax=Metopolophium dirhodum TaxID=44670 RepID=UPI00298F9143|nr:uncharacterized protein LOC132952059 [Metopolophium dirhodum]
MRCLPVIWLPLALAVLITSRCAIGAPTRSQLRQMIAMILYEDVLYNDVLSEKVILDLSDNLPPGFKETVKNLENVDPLESLFALSTPHEYYSGDNLNLSATILGKSLTCLMHKRVAFHLSLTIGMIQNKENRVKFQMRARVFTNAIPYYIDMSAAIYKKYDELLDVYDMLHGMFSSLEIVEDAEYEANIEQIKKKMVFLTGVIKSSCVVNEMKQYCSSLQLENLENCADKITEEDIVSELDVNTYVATLMENENDIFNLFDEMDVLRSMHMDAWKVWLKTPDLPPVTETEEFIRTPLPKYRDEVEEIIATRELAIKEENALAQAMAEKATKISVEIIKPPEEGKPPADSQAGPSDAATPD